MASVPRGPGNFDSIDAMITVDNFVDEMLVLIEEVLAEDHGETGLQRGESELMPTLALLIAAAAESQECPVEPEDVRRWRSVYLARFQSHGRRLFVDDESFQQRLRVIVDTFGRLEELACRLHPDLASDTPQSARN